MSGEVPDDMREAILLARRITGEPRCLAEAVERLTRHLEAPTDA